MTTFEIVYNKQRYQLTLDEQGEPYELLAEQASGPALNEPINTLPSWLLEKVQDWWQNMK